jgi:hypothetical protein
MVEPLSDEELANLREPDVNLRPFSRRMLATIDRERARADRIELLEADVRQRMEDERARAEKAEAAIKELLESERGVYTEANELLRASLGQDLFNELWGPELEKLGEAVDGLIVQRNRAERRCAELEAELAGERGAREVLLPEVARLQAANARIERLEGALRKIETAPVQDHSSMHIARAALKEQK